MATAVLYARVSSDRQEAEGFSIPAQLQYLREYAQAKGLKIEREYLEAESAKADGHRPIFTAMLSDLQKPTAPRHLLCEKTDRLTRNDFDKYRINELIDRHHLTVHLPKEGEAIHKDSSSSAKLMFGLKAVLAKHFIDNLREETRKGLTQRAQRGLWNAPAPYGYRMVNKQLEPDDTRAGLVREVFTLYATGTYSLRSLREALWNRGYRFSAAVQRIPGTTLERMIKNPIYKGVIVYQGAAYAGTHEPLVSLEVWEACQVALRRTNKPSALGKHQFRYRGFLRCGECGCAVTGYSAKGGRYIYYHCSGVLNGSRAAQSCSQRPTRQEEIDRAIVSHMERLVLPPDYRQAVLDALKAAEGDRETAASEHLARMNKRLTDARKAKHRNYEAYTRGLVDQEVFETYHREYSQQVVDCELAIQQLDRADESYWELGQVLLELPEIIATSWFWLDDDKKQILLNAIYLNSTLKDRKPSLQLASPFDQLLNNTFFIDGVPNGAELGRLIRLHAVTLRAIAAQIAA